MLEILFYAAVTGIAFFIKGITGFGNTLVMSPLLSFALSNKIISPLDLLLGLPANALMAFRERNHLKWRVVIPLSLLLLAGIIPGVFLLKAADDRLLKLLLGLAVAASATEMALRKPAGEHRKKPNQALLMVLGAVSGVMCGLFGIGALLAAYISRTTDGMGPFRANLCFVFLVENLFRLGLYMYAGVLSAEVLKLALLLLPAAALGLFVGMKVDLGLKPETTRMAVILLMAASGIVLFATNAIRW